MRVYATNPVHILLLLLVVACSLLSGLVDGFLSSTARRDPPSAFEQHTKIREVDHVQYVQVREQQRSSRVSLSSSKSSSSASPAAAEKTTTKATNSKEEHKQKINARYVAATALMESTSTTKTEFSLRRLETDQHFTTQLDLRDRRFARALVSTVERRKGQIDKLLHHCMDAKSKKPRRRADALVQAALRLGTAQIIFLEIPAHAAVKETVDVLRMDPRIKISEPKIKFVNAVLRRIEREGKELLESVASPYDNISPWLIKEWREAWGEDKLAAIADAAMTESPVYLSANHAPGSSQEEKMQKLQTIQQAFEERAESTSEGEDEAGTEILPHGAIYIDKTKFPGAVSGWPLYNEGDWWVQDASATLPAIALYNSLLAGDMTDADTDAKESSKLDNGHDLSIVDLCAAPGGKTAQLLSLGFPSVHAVELSPRRARQLKSNMERLQLEDRCTISVGDGSQWIPAEGRESVAGVLLDVPCTATGTASRRPDVLRKDDNLDSLLETQYNLATHCVDNLLAPGGILVYATCSLLPQESESQVLKLLQREEGAQLKTLPFTKGEIPGFDEAIDESGNLRVIPGWLPGKLSTCDGFFVARLQKQ